MQGAIDGNTITIEGGKAMNNEYFSEIVYDLTTISDNYRNMNGAAKVDSREVFSTIYALAKRFVAANPEPDDTYITKVEEFGNPEIAALYGLD